ncbi:hypothetical protein EXU57_14945 [Segetibacter sp. 3557_3]|uniref:hypothetical protein n=1 Tax=Segetibacter sp. 3557_3 TaxID=2547429 RepID=UPI001058D61F|nr:hypothetical protein [Segetibacter sp. 3557_3]TDH24631.1 hypothetical protein EXU57_14945 [Segetibacter sp. 3557_3]
MNPRLPSICLLLSLFASAFITVVTGTTVLQRGTSPNRAVGETRPDSIGQLPPPPLMAVEFSGKVFLQGAYQASAGTMTNKLIELRILQSHATHQPYNMGSFGNYPGSEKVLPVLFDQHPEIVDWVMVELTGPALPGITVRRAAFVRKDGVLVDLDGITTRIQFNEVGGGAYYITIRHRNHLAVRTPSPLDFTSGNASHDFTTAASQSYCNQTYTSTVQVGGVWAMRAGNANSNNNLKFNGPFNDQDMIQNVGLGGSISLVKSNQYHVADVNLDGQVKTNGPNNDQNFLLNVALGGLIGMVYVEQL